MEVNPAALKQLAKENNVKFSSVAIVDSVIVDKDEVMLRVTLQPTGEKPMVRMGYGYTGKQFGVYILPEPGIEVLCVFPGNDLNAGIAVCRLNNGIDIIPEGITQDKILIIGNQDHDVDIIIKGNVNIRVEGTVDLEATSINITTGGS